jgi:chemotaxis protein CheC
MDDLAKELGLLEPGDVIVVHQAFTGPISGDALLFLDGEGAVRLTNLFVEEGLRSQSVDTAAGEILVEIGNMLLGSCLGVFGNLLEVRVSFSVPSLHSESLEPLLRSLSIGDDELQYAVVIATSFRVREHKIAGQIAIVLGASSLDRLIDSVEVWERSQCLA